MSDLAEIEIPGDSSIDEILESIRATKGIHDVDVTATDSSKIMVIVNSEMCEGCRMLADSSCFLISATTEEEGWMNWKIIFKEKKCVQTMITNMKAKDFEVRLKKLSNIDDSQMLTDKQQKIIETAYKRGYYDFPKRVGIRELADMFEVSTATLSEILRRGQKKIISSYFDKK